jgi:anti-sigma-K factor RskA
LVQNLPAAPTGKQYQLWTIVDGVPVDMGMLDNDFREKVISMKTAKGNVAAFAITLEKQGGSPSPTLEEMYVLGNV